MEWLLVHWLWVGHASVDVKVVERFKTEAACKAMAQRLKVFAPEWWKRTAYTQYECVHKDD